MSDKQNDAERIKQLKKKERQLKRELAQKEIMSDYYEKMLEIASEDLGFDIEELSEKLKSRDSDKSPK